MLGKVAPGDVLTVTRIDRLARKTFDLFGIASASSTPITIKITCRKPGYGRPTKPWPHPTMAIITTPIAWIAMVSAMSDRPQAQFPLSKRFIL